MKLYGECEARRETLCSSAIVGCLRLQKLQYTAARFTVVIKFESYVTAVLNIILRKFVKSANTKIPKKGVKLLFMSFITCFLVVALLSSTTSFY